MKKFIFRFVLLLGVLTLALPVVQAQDLNAVKARIKARLSTLDSLKASGAVGENNRGFVEVRGGGGDASSVVSAENSDRETVYAAIAQKTGSTADAVGRARARKIAAESASGVWVQGEDGSWAKK
jgi:uncharacterized protein YdbL (DUF1318 family)